MAHRTGGKAPVTSILPGEFMGPYWAPDVEALKRWVETVIG